MPGFLLGQFYHFFITSDNSVSVHHYCGQFGVSSSLLRTIRCQFIIIADNSVSVHHYCFPCIKSVIVADNSVSVHHYCFPCIKSVSWIHGKTSKTDRR